MMQVLEYSLKRVLLRCCASGYSPVLLLTLGEEECLTVLKEYHLSAVFLCKIGLLHGHGECERPVRKQ